MDSTLGESGISLDDFTEGQKGIRVAVEFTFDNMDVRGIKPSEAPSTGAWSMLKWARNSPTNKTTFYCTFVSRLLPSKSQLDLEANMEDDGRDVERLIEQLERNAAELRQPSAERPARELEAP